MASKSAKRLILTPLIVAAVRFLSDIWIRTPPFWVSVKNCWLSWNFPSLVVREIVSGLLPVWIGAPKFVVMPTLAYDFAPPPVQHSV